MHQDIAEDPRFLSDQLITCLGNKRALLPLIGQAFDEILQDTDRRRVRFFDVFSGSGIVSRFARKYAGLIVANDLEPYAEVINRCYLGPAEAVDDPRFIAAHRDISDRLDTGPLESGIIANHYAPRDDGAIQPGERVFYTNRNARFLDTARQAIARVDPAWQPLLLAPLLSEASVHANTAGVFKGFYKNRDTGIGTFGGKKGDALSRIRGDISLPRPVTSTFPVESIILRGDANEICRTAPTVDIAYLDPPYNQHPYGSNYFMLNLLVKYTEPERMSRVSGIPSAWQRSQYNRKKAAADALEDLVATIRARHVLVSFNSEGFISRDTMERILSAHGRVTTRSVSYNTFRGSRNLRNRDLRVTEFLYILEKKP
ncbi:MAG TPA: DNA adenine methylase [Treponemataceae bacterium]|nr:DNA adenine methylase [Treponemataceae bacterium]